MNAYTPERTPAHSPDPAVQDPGVVPSAPRRRGRWIGLASGLIVVVLGAGAALGLAQREVVEKRAVDPESEALSQALRGPLDVAFEECAFDDAEGATLADEGKTLILDTKGEDDFFGLDYIEAICVYDALEVPSRVINQIGATRALDGRVTDSWDVFTATWSYHPNSGLDLMITTD